MSINFETVRRFALSLTVGLFVLLAAGTAAAEGPSGDEIIDKALERNSLGFEEGTARTTLIIEDKAGNRRVRKLEVKSKKLDSGARTLVTLTAPKEVENQAFLFAENEDGEDDVWMYVPAFKVTRRIEGSQKDGAFLGSHFTYADLESRPLEDGKYKRLDDGKIGEHEVYVVEVRPKEDVESNYGKVRAYVRKSDYMPLKLKFYDKQDELEKTLFVEKLDETEDGDKYIKRMTLRPEVGGYTTMKLESLDSETEIPDSALTRDQLGK